MNDDLMPSLSHGTLNTPKENTAHKVLTAEPG